MQEGYKKVNISGEETLTKLSKLLSREKELFSKPFPKGAGIRKQRFITVKWRRPFRTQALEKGCLQELVQMAADKVKERELFRELSFTGNTANGRNIALCRAVGVYGKRADSTGGEKPICLIIPEENREAVFVDSTI